MIQLATLARLINSEFQDYLAVAERAVYRGRPCRALRVFSRLNSQVVFVHYSGKRKARNDDVVRWIEEQRAGRGLFSGTNTNGTAGGSADTVSGKEGSGDL